MVMRRRTVRLHGLLSALAALGLASALPLVSPSLSAQSLAESRITIGRGDAVQISEIDDWEIGVFGPDDDISNIAYRWDGTCVFSTTGAFRVEVSLANRGTGPLRLRNGDGVEMAYEIYTYSQAVGGAYQMVRFTNGPVVQTNRVASQVPDCEGASNMYFTALVRPGPFNAAPSGVYRDYATIIVTPE